MKERIKVYCAVVAINPDGSLYGRWPSMASASRALGRCRSAVYYALQKGNRCMGKLLMPEEYYVPAGDYHFSPTRGRTLKGSFAKGHHLNYGRRLNLSSEDIQKRREKAFQRTADPCDGFGKHQQQCRPTLCITDGRAYFSITAAAKAYGIPLSSVLYNIYESKSRITHGKKFRLLLKEEFAEYGITPARSLHGLILKK